MKYILKEQNHGVNKDSKPQIKASKRNNNLAAGRWSMERQKPTTGGERGRYMQRDSILGIGYRPEGAPARGIGTYGVGA